MTAQEIVDCLNRGSENFSFCCKLEELIDNDKVEEAIDCIKSKFHCDKETANQSFIEFKKQIYDEFKKIENENPLSQQQIAHNQAVAKESLNKPKCPTCQSINIKKISVTSKVTNATLFGLFGTKRYKTFHCNNCGYEW